MKRLISLLLGLILTLSLYLDGTAASVEITPTQLYLTADTPTAVLTLKNLDDQPLLLQTHAVDWQQTAAGDDYKKTNALIINPPIFTIQPHSFQVIRLGLRDKLADLEQEKSYRVFMTEVLPNAKQGQGVTTLLQLNLPVFVEPVVKQGKLVWQFNRVNSNTLSVHLANQSNTHIQVFKLSLYNHQTSPLTSQKVFTYLLPMQSKAWTLDLQPDVDVKQIKLVASTDRGDITYNAPVTTP